MIEIDSIEKYNQAFLKMLRSLVEATFEKSDQEQMEWCVRYSTCAAIINREITTEQVGAFVKSVDLKDGLN